MALCVRLNSLTFCLSQLEILSHYIDSHWTTLQEGLRKRGLPTPPPLQTILHKEALLAVHATIDEMCIFIGAKVVFDDLKEPILQQLYIR